jgi:hypothetical protein
MGTRTLVHIKDGKKTIATIYRQYDGYPTGMGDDIKEILNNGMVNILNGFGNHQVPQHFNGMGCLAAYLIGELKNKKIGNVYIYPANSKDVGEDFTYTISEDLGILNLKVVENSYDGNKTLFKGALINFDGKTVEGIDEENVS